MDTANKPVVDIPDQSGRTATPLYSYRWAILAVAFSLLITSFVVRVAWGNAAVYAGQSLSLNATEMGSIVTAFFVGYTFFNACGGFMVDRFGPSRTLCCAVAPLGLFTFCFGFVNSLYQGIAIQVLMGLSAGVNFSATTKIVSAWFPPAYRGRAFGITAMASSFPVIIANASFPYIIEHYSWGALYRGLGAFAIVIAVLCFFTLRDVPPNQTVASTKTVAKPAILVTLREIIHNRNLVIFTIAGFGGTWGTWGFGFWSNALLVKGHGYSPITAGEIMTLWGIGGIFAKPLIGLLSDFLGGRRRNLMLLCFLCLSISLLVFGWLDSVLAFKLAAPFLGAAAFAYNPLQTALLSELIGKRMVGSAAGLSNAFTQIASVICPLVVGLVFDLTASFHAAFIVLTCGPLFSALCMSFVHEPDASEKSKE